MYSLIPSVPSCPGDYNKWLDCNSVYVRHICQLSIPMQLPARSACQQRAHSLHVEAMLLGMLQVGIGQPSAFPSSKWVALINGVRWAALSQGSDRLWEALAASCLSASFHSGTFLVLHHIRMQLLPHTNNVHSLRKHRRQMSRSVQTGRSKDLARKGWH